MKAVRFIEVGKPAQIVDVPKPEPGPGQVVIKIGGAGVCHSDLHVLDDGIGVPGPFTLGHENAGWVAAVGAGARRWREGDAVGVYGPWGCGHCHACMQSMENYCENARPGEALGGGLGRDGGMAEYMLVPAERLLVPLGRLDPHKAAPLGDAALTPYHAIKRALPLLTPDATAVVLGVGGLGHMAVQLIRCLSGARIAAGDIDDAKLALAASRGADLTVNTRSADEAVERINEFAGPRKAALVLDCVGVQATVDLGARVVGSNSHFTIVGLGGGVIKFTQQNLPFGCAISTPYWGSRAELLEVLALAEAGRIHSEISLRPLGEAPEVYQRLREGGITGRVVLTPEAI